MPVDFKKLTRGEIVVVIAGLLLLIFSFFDWYGAGGSVRVFGEEVEVGFSLNGWDAPDSFFSIVAILIGVVMAAQVIATKVAGVNAPEKLGAIGWGMIHLVLGVIALLFLLIKWLGNMDGPEKFGLYVAILCGIGLAVGGYLIAKERGELPATIGGKS